MQDDDDIPVNSEREALRKVLELQRQFAPSAPDGARVPNTEVRRLASLAPRWIDALRTLGIHVARGQCDAFVAFDGKGTLHVAADNDLDPDDTLPQILLHELCHALVEGPHTLHLPDWGLRNEDLHDHPREVLALRLQWALCRDAGLEHSLVPTTAYRLLWTAWLRNPDPADRAAHPVLRDVERAATTSGTTAAILACAHDGLRRSAPHPPAAAPTPAEPPA